MRFKERYLGLNIKYRERGENALKWILMALRQFHLFLKVFRPYFDSIT